MREGIDLPTHGVDFYVDVPGGGDWSNSRLSLETAPAVIEWTEVKHNV